jgi:hypothetical protein
LNCELDTPPVFCHNLPSEKQVLSFYPSAPAQLLEGFLVSVTITMGEPPMSRKILSLMLGFLLLVSFKGHSALAQPDLQYRNRGNRYEGVKPKPVAGYDIELISVLVDYREEAKRMPNQGGSQADAKSAQNKILS